jgi:predicted RNA-binding Zn-ribbon protein involved in translation (DUF1610 family)
MMTGIVAKTTSQFIAPCGLNCRICRAFIRNRKACRGCREDDRFKPKTCAECPIKNCKMLTDTGLKYCIDCAEFPCTLITRLEKRYSSKYGVSVVDNLMAIKEGGIMLFVETENTKWNCPNCGKILCMHKAQCFACGYSWRG